MRKYLIFLIFIFTFSAPLVAFASDGDLIFTPDGIRFSRSRFLEGQPVLIYASAFSNQPVDLRGAIRFFDGNTQIGSDQPISVVDGRPDAVFVEWTPQAPGEHNIRATILPLSRNDDSNVTNNTSVVETRVLYDSDRDSVPNIEDPDDDNDGASDATETANGTNPYDAQSVPPQESGSNTTQTANITPAESVSNPPSQNANPTADAATNQIGGSVQIPSETLSLAQHANAPSATPGGGVTIEQTPTIIIVTADQQTENKILSPNEPISFEIPKTTPSNEITETEWIVDGQTIRAPRLQTKFDRVGFHRVVAKLTNNQGELAEKTFSIFVIQPALLWSFLILIFLLLILAIFLTFFYSKRRRSRWETVHSTLDNILKWLPVHKKSKK